MNHRNLASEAAVRIAGIKGISAILLYGSVARGEERADSDIDLAVVIDDIMKSLPLDEEPAPVGMRESVNRLVLPLERDYNVKFHIPFYWESEFNDGVEVGSGRKLNKVGEFLFRQTYIIFSNQP